jgi:hypothetical protein
MTRLRRALFLAAWSLASLAIAIVVAELVLRTLAFSTGDGGVGADQRWSEKYWKPVNSHGLRDVEWVVPNPHPALVFLGDSFTEGHGVRYEQTYYYAVRTTLAARATAYSLGRSGASSRAEAKDYAQFLKETGIRPRWVVHQYFGNDMQDLLPPPPRWKPWPGLETMARHSELADIVWTYMDGVRWGRLYADHYLGGYENPEAYARHRADLEALVDRVHGDGALWLFVVFPFLDNDEYLRKSGDAYIVRMRSLFQERCAPGDAFVDVTPLALAMPLPERTVNKLDGHPSPALHAALAARLAPLLDAPGRAPLPDGVLACRRHG